jgi:hypothetical protein
MMKRNYPFLAALLVVGFVYAALFRASSMATAQEKQTQAPSHPQAIIGTSFTYQGKLTDGGSPADGAYDFQFILYDAASGGSQVGSTLIAEDSPVSDGLFTVELDFGAVFDGTALWLEVGVRDGSSTGAYTTLNPRSPLTATPYALYSRAAPWSGLSGAPAGFADNVDNDILGGLSCANGEIPEWDGLAWVCGTDDVGSGAGGGDITAVFAGTGLNGGGPSGDVTLTVAGPYLLPQSCANGEIPAWTGSDWACAVDDNTTYSAGTGLTLSGGQFALIASYRLPQGCTNGQIAEWNGSAWACGADNDSGGDITAVNAGTGLSGGGPVGSVTLNANFAGSGSANSVSHSDHDHWGQTWSGSVTGLTLHGGNIGLDASGATYGVFGQSDSDDGTGVFGLASNASGITSGVYGQSDSNEGRGMVGWASAPSGTTYGAIGLNYSTAGTGVWGWATANSGNTYGVSGRSDSINGTGVYGEAPAASGTTYGVFGQSDSGDGTGVFGLASNASGITSGMYGQSDSNEGRGMVGWASATSGNTYGAIGLNYSTSGTGVWGWATANSGNTYGVSGRSDSTNGMGVYGEATAGTGFTDGVHGQSQSTDGTGVYGKATASSGTTYGVYGQSNSTSGTGVEGWATAASGTTYGVFGASSSIDGTAVYGLADSLIGTTYGLYGESISTGGTGVYGEASASSGTTYGVYGVSDGSDFSTGVRGIASADSGLTNGVYGASNSTSGIGVFGSAGADSGTTYGVWGVSNSTSGRGVYGWAPDLSGSTIGVVGQSNSTSGQGVKGTATATSGTTYGVVGNNSSPDGYAGYFRNTSSGVGLYVQTDSGSDNIIEAASGFGELEFKVARDGTVFSDGGFTTPAADYAELLPAHAGLEPGDVLVIGPDGELARSTSPAQTAVVGVYSTQPGFIAGAGDESADISDLVPLAVMGVVPVKVTAENGPIQPGDLLTSSSTAGHAMRAGVDPMPGTIIGKALAPWKVGIGTIKMLVMLC